MTQHCLYLEKPNRKILLKYKINSYLSKLNDLSLGKGGSMYE